MAGPLLEQEFKMKYFFEEKQYNPMQTLSSISPSFLLHITRNFPVPTSSENGELTA